MANNLSPFHELDLDALASAALQRAEQRRCSIAQVRIEQIKSQYLSLRDARLEGSSDDTELGVGVRVVFDGALGFAASVEIDVDSVAALVDQAIDAARASARTGSVPVELANEAGHGRVDFSVDYRIDPTSVSLEDKVGRFSELSQRLLSAPSVDHVFVRLGGVLEDKYYADSAGTIARQHRVRMHPSIEVLGLHDQGFESMRTLSPPVGRGYEYVSDDGNMLEREIGEMPELLAAKLAAPSVEPGRYDLVIDPSNLWLTIHESVGHATEYDRALGYEAAYAGTSFATPDGLNHLQYGSALMNITGDRTVDHGLASIGYDDEGVQAQRFPIVSDGVLVGYQFDRQFAHLAGLSRSNGCAFADSPLHQPIQRMANVSLASAGPEGPGIDELIGGVERGIYVVGDNSWSIDMQRHNFQFTGQRFFKIESGRLAGQLKDVAYQAVTTDFWGSLVALGGEQTYVLGGAMNCGKGQPGQTAPVSHGCPAAVFAGVNILNTKAESGR